jgi:hypothetical protein
MAKVKVVKGDTLSAIAKAASTPGNKVTVADIVKANPKITDPNKINVGQQITIPTPVKKAPTPSPTSGVIPKFTPPPTSGVISGFTPQFTSPPQVKPGDPGFIGPFIPKANPEVKEEPLPEMPSDADMAAAEEAYQDALKSQQDTTQFTAVGTLLRYEAGSKPGLRIPVYADGKGGEFMGEESNNPVNPGSTGFEDTGIITLASNTFANTLALLMGESEAGQPWVEELRQLTQGFINTGSDVEAATNLALREAKAKGKASKFVQRFDAIFKLQDRLNKGETVQVPTIAEYVNSEQQLGDVLRGVGLGELATQEFSARVFGDANKSVSEATDLIANVFNAIDNAPDALKKDLQVGFPGLDRTAIAKAMLLGKEGALELTKKVKSIEQVSAAKSQGVTIDSAMGSSLAAGGADYTSSLGKFETVKQLERGQALGRMSNIDFAQQDAISSAFQSSAAANEKIRRINEEEINRMSAKTGRLNSQSRAQGQF